MIAPDRTHDSAATSWVPGADDHPDFPVQNLPLGIFSVRGSSPRPGCAIGDRVLDIAAALGKRMPGNLGQAVQRETLNALFALPSKARRDLRHLLFDLLSNDKWRGACEPHLHPAADCTMHLPFRIGDYTDFYVGIHHATNIGKLFRPDNPLLPNYRHLPIGYHGRASSVRVSGTPLVRPTGQIKPAPDAAPVVTPSKRLDYELELGVWIAGENPLGEPVPIADAWDRIGGFCALNDWSARDIQAFEYQPLGPFLAKNFLTTVSPWVVTAEALAPFHMHGPARAEGDPALQPYLADEADRKGGGLSLDLKVLLSSAAMREAGLPAMQLSEGPASNMYWSFAQMVTHHTVNGCDLHPGDLLGSGTISGPERASFGSLIELTSGGKQPITLPTGEERRFLEDGDEVALSVVAVKDGYRSIGFGPCFGTVQPARG